MELIAAALRRGPVRAWIILTIGYWIFLWITPRPPEPLVKIVWSMLPSDRPAILPADPDPLNPGYWIPREANWTDYDHIEKFGIIAGFPLAALVIGLAVAWVAKGFSQRRKA